MLLVILGAGASYDSLRNDVLGDLTVGDIQNYRPPLATELFTARPSFGNVLDKFPEAADLVGELRRKIASGAAVEEELESYQEEAAEYPPLHRKLMAIRFYLQETLWTCGTKWQELSHGITNYVDFFSRLDRWRHGANETVCVVNFNYDLLGDEAMRSTLGVDLSSVESFVADDRYRYLKLHGSANWGRRVRAPGDTHYAKAHVARAKLMDNASELEISDDFAIRAPDENPADSSPYPSILMPAIAIPVRTKFAFECPPSHLEVLDACLRDTMKIVVIGWRGTEKHFLDRFSGLPGMAPRVQIVGASEEGTWETAGNLASVGLDESSMERFTDGFSPYLESDHLERFLNE